MSKVPQPGEVYYLREGEDEHRVIVVSRAECGSAGRRSARSPHCRHG